jgi:hypothetical protein
MFDSHMAAVPLQIIHASERQRFAGVGMLWRRVPERMDCEARLKSEKVDAQQITTSVLQCSPTVCYFQLARLG